MLRHGVRIFSLVAVALLRVSSTCAQQPSSQPPTATEVLTNGDVVKMVEAKLGNDIVPPGGAVGFGMAGGQLFVFRRRARKVSRKPGRVAERGKAFSQVGPGPENLTKPNPARARAGMQRVFKQFGPQRT